MRCYDASSAYKAKVDMPRYHTTDLKPGDIVLIEMSVIRWAPKTDSDVSGGKKKKSFKARREWRNWNAEFKLDALSLIYTGSDYADNVREDEAFAA